MLVRVSVVALLTGLLHVVAAAPASATQVVATVDVVTSSEPGTLHVRGWAFDPDSTAAQVEINVYIGPANDDGHSFRAGRYRPDVNSVYPSAGDYHGFDETLTVRPDLSGPQQVWIVAHNIGAGEGPATIYHDVVAIGDAIPTGAVESSSSPAHRMVELKGWASDANEPAASVAIEAYVGGSFNTAGVDYFPLTANISRSDGKLGFSGDATTTKTGAQPVYIYAKNVPGTPGADRLIGVVQVTIYVDQTPPDTEITYAPATATTNDVIRVTFSADEPNATFECRWDQEPWFACQTGAQIKLTPGKHQIAVRATDAYGNTDPQPAVILVTVTAAPTTQPPPPGEQAGLTVAARAVKKKSKLRIDVGPDSASSNYRVVIQRKVGKRWRKVERVRTRGARDAVVVNLRRGKYRVVLPKSEAGPALKSNTVRLRR